MKIIRNIKSYLFAQTECFIPRCKARCCGDAPLPEGFAEQVGSLAYRKVYGAVNIGVNSPNDNYNSIVYNTRPVPLVLVGHANAGGHVYYFDEKLAKKMKISKEQATEKLKAMEAQEVYNYCPFLNSRGRCNVYSMRPPICREFGSSPLPIDYCPRKSSRYDKFIFYAKMFSPKKIFLFYKDLIMQLFRKPQQSC